MEPAAPFDPTPSTTTNPTPFPEIRIMITTPKRNAFTYRGCVATPEQLPREILVGCNQSVNRYLRLVWRITFPDQTWVRVGTKDMVRRYVEWKGHQHGVTP
jgi:hypothetical protein